MTSGPARCVFCGLAASRSRIRETQADGSPVPALQVEFAPGQRIEYKYVVLEEQASRSCICAGPST